MLIFNQAIESVKAEDESVGTMSRARAGYVEHGRPGQQCADCSMHRPAGSCTLVASSLAAPISPAASCDHFDRKPDPAARLRMVPRFDDDDAIDAEPVGKQGDDDMTTTVDPAAIAAYLAPHAPQLAAAVAAESLEKQQPGAADVHQTTALGNDGKGRAKTFLTTIAELKDGAKLVAVPDQVGDADPTQTDGLAEKRAADDLAIARAGLETTPTDVLQELVDHEAETLGPWLHGVYKEDLERRKRAAPRVLKPIDADNSHTPFLHDANALGNLRADQVPRFLGALTDQDRLPTKRVNLSGLTAIQDRVDHGKVAEMQENPPDKPPLVVRAGGRNLIADGHHRLTADLLNGAKTALVRFHDISDESNAVKRAALAELLGERADEDAGTVAFEAAVTVTKFLPDEQKVFGWASVTHIDGELVVDKQDDIIEPEVLEKASHDFVLYAREQGNMHEERNVGRLIESLVFTPEKFDKCGLTARDPQTGEQIYGWWVGFKTEDAETWAAIKRGDLPEFSIGGRAIRTPFDDDPAA